MPFQSEQSAKIAKVGRGGGPMLLSVAAERGNRKPYGGTFPGGNDCPGKPTQVGPDFLISWPIDCRERSLCRSENRNQFSRCGTPRRAFPSASVRSRDIRPP